MENNISQEISKLEKKVLYTRMSSILFILTLVIGSLLEIPLYILSIVVISAAVVLIGFVGIPTMVKLSSLKRQLSENN
ncbi:MAG: hypothetical protein K0S41_1185 [Anaerocolumna sp.]|jgi:uncharacterized membrane protein YcaP (DUF421 family)|nr:hypothetical protein [Anaerocolumna sp.]